MLERLPAYRFRPTDVCSYSDWWWDNYAYQLYELFLYAVAAFVRLKRFDALASFFGRQFVLPESSNRNNRAVGFRAFRFHSELLHHLAKQAAEPEFGTTADLVKQRAALASYPLTSLIQADVLPERPAACVRLRPTAATLLQPTLWAKRLVGTGGLAASRAGGNEGRRIPSLVGVLPGGADRKMSFRRRPPAGAQSGRISALLREIPAALHNERSLRPV